MLEGKRLKRLVAALAVGAFAISLPTMTDAKRIHDTKVTIKSEERQIASRSRTVNVEETNAADTQARVRTIVKPGVKPHSVLNPNFDMDSVIQQEITDESNISGLYSGNVYVRKTVSRYDTSIIGTPLATQEQCVNYLLSNNPYPNLPISAEEIVQIYYEEGAREGIRPDVAFAQALKETGFFRYGGDVVPEQNNYCGLGTTGGGVRGSYFSSPRMGVRAHIQHLLAYSSTRKPTTQIVDPRYDLVRETYGARTLGDWQDLNGRWAVPGYHYGQEILSMFNAILVQ